MARPFITHLETLIADGETQSVLNILLDFFTHRLESLSDLIAESKDELRDECILHQGALRKSDKDLQRGLITDEEQNQVVSRINYALLALFPNIESLTFDDAAALQRAEFIEKKDAETDNSIGNIGEIKKRKLLKNIAIGTLSLALLIVLGWMFKDRIAPKKIEPVVGREKKSKEDSLFAAEVHLNLSVNHRTNNDFDACIKECQDALKWNDKNAYAYNQLAECYLYKGEITAAFENAKKAYKCDSIDVKGFTMSTLAQIYGEMDNTKYFYIYTEEALKRDLPVWDYEDELGFKKYKDESKFKILIKKYQDQK
jgi:tetratricopeptide (TPR) repeat protein